MLKTKRGALTTPDIMDGHKGTAVRRYAESDMFGLYEGNNVPDEDDLKEIFQTLTRHNVQIEKYDARYEEFLGDASARYGYTVESLDETVELAKNLMVNLYAPEADIDKVFIDYTTSIDGTGAETDNLDFRTNWKWEERTENMLIIGLAGNDVIYAGAGDDYIFGDGGNDILIGGSGTNHLYGGSGRDTADFSADAFGGKGIEVTLDADGNGSAIPLYSYYSEDGEDESWSSSLNSIENLVGTGLEDSLYLTGSNGRLIDGGKSPLFYSAAYRVCTTISGFMQDKLNCRCSRRLSFDHKITLLKGAL